MIQHHKASEYSDSATVMALVLHPDIVSAPHRMKYFRQVLDVIRHKEGVMFCTGDQIFDRYQGERKRLGEG
jgi:hypothetical protein